MPPGMEWLVLYVYEGVGSAENCSSDTFLRRWLSFSSETSHESAEQLLEVLMLSCSSVSHSPECFCRTCIQQFRFPATGANRTWRRGMSKSRYKVCITHHVEAETRKRIQLPGVMALPSWMIGSVVAVSITALRSSAQSGASPPTHLIYFRLAKVPQPRLATPDSMTPQQL